MEVKIIEKKKNAVLHRTEVSFVIEDASGTPKRTDVKTKLEALLAASTGTVLVVKLGQLFGKNDLEGMAYQYDSAELLQKMDKKSRLKKNGLYVEPVKEEKKEEAPAA